MKQSCLKNGLVCRLIHVVVNLINASVDDCAVFSGL